MFLPAQRRERPAPVGASAPERGQTERRALAPASVSFYPSRRGPNCEPGPRWDVNAYISNAKPVTQLLEPTFIWSPLKLLIDHSKNT